MRLPISLDINLREYEKNRPYTPGMGSGDAIRQYVMKAYRAGKTELNIGLESWRGPFTYTKNGETYICGYRVWNPHRLVSPLHFRTNYALIVEEYGRLLKGGKR